MEHQESRRGQKSPKLFISMDMGANHLSPKCITNSDYDILVIQRRFFDVDQIIMLFSKMIPIKINSDPNQQEVV